MEASTPEVELVEEENHGFQEYLHRHKLIKDKDAQIVLRNALINYCGMECTNF